MRRRPIHSSRMAAVGATIALFAVAGCGGSSTYKNDPRPPAPITVTASIDPDGIAVSPKHFGAGPISLLVVNQTDRSQRVTVERRAVGKEPFQQQTSPISPHGTASLKTEITPGTYVVKVDGAGIKSARVVVGPERPSAQNDLLQP
jgi:hypothetical protein